MRSYLYHILFIAFCFAACKPSESTMKSQTQSKVSDEVISKEKILFLNYKISKKEDKTLELVLISQILNTGKIKGYKPNNQLIKIGNLKCLQMDSAQMELDVLYLSNPLFREHEFVDEEGNFQRKSLTLDSADLNFRIQLHPLCYEIKIEEIIDSDFRTRELIKTKVILE